MSDTFQQAVEKGLEPKQEPTDKEAVEKKVVEEFITLIKDNYGIAGFTALGTLATLPEGQKASGIDFSYDPNSRQLVSTLINEPVIKMGGEALPSSSTIIKSLRKHWKTLTNKSPEQQKPVVPSKPLK